MVKIFEGKEIDKSKIDLLKSIAYRRYTKEIYNEYFSDVKDVTDLAYLHNVNIDEEKLVIGTDWFLCYSESDYYVKILEWVSIDNGNKLQQAGEMMHILKKILLQNKEKLFIAWMRHDTSYSIYLKMLQRGFFQELNHKYTLDCAAPSQVRDLERNFRDKFHSIEDFLASDVSNDYVEYHRYILHHLSFLITDKFIKKYSESSTKSQEQKLRKKR